MKIGQLLDSIPEPYQYKVEEEILRIVNQYCYVARGHIVRRATTVVPAWELPALLLGVAGGGFPAT